MKDILILILGLIIGGTIMIIIMSCLQINKTDFEYENFKEKLLGVKYKKWKKVLIIFKIVYNVVEGSGLWVVKETQILKY